MPFGARRPLPLFDLPATESISAISVKRLALFNNPLVRFTVSFAPEALRSVMPLISPRLVRNPAAATECSRLARLISLICFATLLEAPLRSVIARACSAVAFAACSVWTRILSAAVVICVAPVACSDIARATLATSRRSALPPSKFARRQSLARSQPAKSNPHFSASHQAPATISLTLAACSAVALRTWIASAAVFCPALITSRAARPCSPIACATSFVVLRIC